jgi:TetR/AcrR family transcriptional regulator, tetracycline repressor protein
VAVPSGRAVTTSRRSAQPATVLRTAASSVVLHQAGFDLADASRAAATFIWFVVGRTAEEQTLPDLAAIQRRGDAEPSILSRAMAARSAPDDQDVSFRFGVRVMIAGLRALLAGG